VCPPIARSIADALECKEHPQGAKLARPEAGQGRFGHFASCSRLPDRTTR
jgi:hypothetical protein